MSCFVDEGRRPPVARTPPRATAPGLDHAEGKIDDQREPIGHWVRERTGAGVTVTTEAGGG